MKALVFSVFDLAAAVYGRPAFYASKGLAIRAFTDEVNRADKENVLYNHPGDFQLFYIGEFDDLSGRFESVVPERILLASEVKSN